MIVEALGLGDLHLDGGLKQYVANLNEVICDEIRVILKYAKRNGIRKIIFYGDIAHKPVLSVEATMLFLNVMQQNPNLKFYVMSGNHDVEHKGEHSLLLLKHICESGWLEHVKVIDEPRRLNLGTKADPAIFNFLPWPATDTTAKAVNVLHTEAAGAKWDSGSAVSKNAKAFPDTHFCLSGHLHTPQTAGGVNYSGTFYQTNFAERLPKYFHHIKWDTDRQKGEVELVPHKPTITLHNIIVKTKDDLKEIPDDANKLCKLFIKDGIDIDAALLDQYPNVVKHNSFKSNKDLEVLLNEDLILGDESDSIRFNDEQVLDDWMDKNKIDKAKQKIVRQVRESLLRKNT